MKRIILLSSFFLFSLFKLHAVSTSPVDVRGLEIVGSRHSGYGEYSDVDDYEGVNILKRNCTALLPEILKSEEDCRPSFFSFFRKKRDPVNKLVATIEDDYTQTLLSNYAGIILSSEVQNACGVQVPPISCPAKVFEDNIINTQLMKTSVAKAQELPSHEDIRRNALVLQNAISAALLSKRCSISEPLPAVRIYQNRLKLQYPYLFETRMFHNRGYSEIIELLQLEGISVPADETILSPDLRLHANSMRTIMAAIDRNPELKEKLQKKLGDLLQDYGQKIKKDIDPASAICSMSSKDLFIRYPQVVNQAFIDLAPEQRNIMSASLCKIKEFYNPHDYDTDCDGIVDSDDSSPENSFVPINEFKIATTTMENPPFSTGAYYSIKKESGKISISIDVDIASDSTVTPEQKSGFLSKYSTCVKTDLVNEFQKNFEIIKQEKSHFFNSTDEIDIKFNIQERSSPYAIALHKCYCSTCNLKYNFEGQQKSVPENYCLENIKNGILPEGESITQQEMDAIKAAYLAQTQNNTVGGVWFVQENSSNLTISADCGTLKHETIHRFGLPDEYVSSYYPFDRVGSSNSIMNNEEKNVLPRHLARILSPDKTSNFCSI